MTCCSVVIIVEHMARYLSACEAFWRLFAYNIHGRQPSVKRLVVHIPNMNRVIFA